MKQFILSQKNGFGLIEVVIATGVITIALSAFLQTGVLAIRLLRAEKSNLEAGLLAEEGLHATRAIRDETWTNISSATIGSPYYPVVENGKWKLSSFDPGALNGKFTRTIVFDRVYRNSADQIAATGTEDANTRKVTVTISWDTKTYRLPAYITNFQASLILPTESKTIFFEDTPTDANFANVPSPDTGSGDPAQSFTTSSGVDVTKVELLLRRATSNPSHIYAELRTSPTGTILGTSQLLDGMSIANSAPSWVSFRFELAVALNPGIKYYVRLRSIPSSTDAGNGSAGFIHWSYRQTPGGPYVGGEAYTGIGQLSNPSNQGILQNDYDFGFRIFTQ